MSRGFCPWIAVVLMALPAAASETLRPDDFATGRAIEATGDDPLQTLLLDLLVYRGSVGSGLSDLRVFNAQGEAVPHAIRTLAQPETTPETSVALPVFRLPGAGPGAKDGPDPAIPDRLARSHSVSVEVGPDGAIVRVSPVGAAPGAPSPGSAMGLPAALPTAILLDQSRLPREAVGLELDLGPEPAEFVVPLRVEVSDDLIRFRAHGARSAVARLAQGGHRIERSSVSFPATRARYLLLSADGEPLPVEIRAARARLAPAVQPPPRHEARLPGSAVADAPGAYLFDAGGGVPVDRVQVALPQSNTVVRAELFSAPSAEGPWMRRHAGILYRLARTPPLRNDPIALPAKRHRYWRLDVAPEGGGLGGGTPTLEVSWHPEQLLFVQRGAGPFALGYGRADTERARFSAPELLRAVGAPPEAVPRETASLGPPRPVGDPSVLESRPEPAPRPPYGLWAFLVLAVAGVLGLSLRLLRQMRAEGEGSG